MFKKILQLTIIFMLGGLSPELSAANTPTNGGAYSPSLRTPIKLRHLVSSLFLSNRAG